MLRLTVEKEGAATEVFELTDTREQAAEGVLALLRGDTLNRNNSKGFVAITSYEPTDNKGCLDIEAVQAGGIPGAINACLAYITGAVSRHPQAERIAAAIADDLYHEAVRLANLHAPAASPIITPAKKKLVL